MRRLYAKVSSIYMPELILICYCIIMYYYQNENFGGNSYADLKKLARKNSFLQGLFTDPYLNYFHRDQMS